MKPEEQIPVEMPEQPPSLESDLLLLPNGRLLVHNLTPAMAEVLRKLDPEDQVMRKRAAASPGRFETVRPFASTT